MARAPIVPKSIDDPAGLDRSERGAINAFNAKIARCNKAYRDIIGRLNPQAIVANRSYTYELDQSTLNAALSDAAAFVDSELLAGGVYSNWFFEDYVKPGYDKGLAQQFANLSTQSPVYLAGRVSLGDIIRTPEYSRRMALLAAREFNEMEGLAASVKANLSRILAAGVARGQSPDQVAKDIKANLTIDQNRAKRIARTEIHNALIQAKLDETQEAQQRYGLRTMEMHISALSNTTRLDHAERSGKLYTVEQQREWWAQGANSINCKCSTTTVLVDDNNEPLVPMAQQRVIATREKFEKEGRGPWSKKK